MSVIRHPSTGTAVTVKQWRYTATGGETTLSGTDGFGLSLSYTVGAEEVYINGVLLVRGTDYTASTGTSITGLTALVAGDVATVMSANSFNVANAIAASTVTAKGDLIVANGAASVSNLAVGADGTTLVANSSSATGVAWAGPITTAGKNFLINGGMDIWQRGTSFSIGTSPWTYTADRFAGVVSTGTATYAQETTVVPSGSRYSMKITAGATQIPYFAQEIETMNVIPFAGKTITVSAQLAASTSIPMNLVVGYTTTVDDSVATAATAITPTTGGTATPTSTTFVPITGTYAIPSNAKSIRVYFAPASNMTSGQSIYIGQVQLEIGSVATSFSRAGGTVQGELAACQRYYWRNTAGGSYSRYALGVGASSSQVWFQVYNPVPMRVSPTSVDYANLRTDDTGSGQTITAIGFTGDGANPYTCNVYANVSSGITQFRPYILENNGNTAGYIGFSAEL